MPRFDLRQDDGSAHSLAPFKVLAVLCHPTDSIRREAMLAHVERGTSIARPRRTPISGDAFTTEVRYAASRAGVAASLLLTMLQLRESGLRPSIRQAMPLVADPLPKWDFSAFAWSKDCHLTHRPRSKTTMLEAWKAYQLVLHLWAALLHGEQWGRRDIWPGSNETLPNFLAYADTILDLACDLPSFAPERGLALRREDAWTFTLPRPAEAPRLIAMPLYDEQLAMITTSSAART